MIKDWRERRRSSSMPTTITGRRLFAAISVLEGGPHSLSSMYEALFHSILFICSDGQQPRSPGYVDSLRKWSDDRRDGMQWAPDMHGWGVQPQHVALIRALHELFYPATALDRRYRIDVTLEEFAAACDPFIACP